VINELPIHHVLTAYFDDLFENMDEAELEEAREDLLKTDEERAKDKDQKDAEEVDIYQLMQDTAKEAESLSQKVKDIIKSGTKPLVTNKGDVPLINPLTDQSKAMKDIKMNFMTEKELNAKLEQEDSLGLLEDP
jgi:hypothetical protein